MRRIALIACLALPGVAQAEDWTLMTGEEIGIALTDRTLQYKSASQTFYASGKTLYDSGRPSWGYWEVRGDQYCSTWPPNDLWACYDMDRQGDRLRFVGQGDDITEATYAD